MKLAIVVQRYGAEVSGGAELHARYIAEHLARFHEVEVLTTCARDYVTWRNELAPGLDSVHGVAVRRFPVRHPRDPEDFGRWSARVFDAPHSTADELAWLESEGPACPALVRYVERHRDAYDFFLFFSYRYYHAYHGCRAVPGRAILVPTAERDPAVGVSLFGPIFRGVRALMYNSPEERAMIQAVSGNQEVPSVVVGVGVDAPDRTDAARFRQKFDLREPFAVYVGRLDENKGCPELFDYFARYADAHPRGLSLVLVGTAVMSLPVHPRIRYLGVLPDQDKFDAIAAADVLVMPSHYESLSMVVLEAWAAGRPVLVNGRCDVLRGQVVRSGGGLYYENFEEFVETLYALEAAGPLHARLGRSGRAYFERHYAWPVVERKYLDMLDRLARDDAGGRVAPALTPLPGWWARRRSDLPPARQVVDALPSGPVVDVPGAAPAKPPRAPAPARPAGGQAARARRRRRPGRRPPVSRSS